MPYNYQHCHYQSDWLDLWNIFPEQSAMYSMLTYVEHSGRRKLSCEARCVCWSGPPAAGCWCALLFSLSSLVISLIPLHASPGLRQGKSSFQRTLARRAGWFSPICFITAFINSFIMLLLPVSIPGALDWHWLDIEMLQLQCQYLLLSDILSLRMWRPAGPPVPAGYWPESGAPWCLRCMLLVGML